MPPCRAEREQARAQQQSIGSKLFILEGSDETGCPVYTPAPQVQQVCQVVDGFIYIANAENGRGQMKLCCYYFSFPVTHIIKKKTNIYKPINIYFIYVYIYLFSKSFLQQVIRHQRPLTSEPYWAPAGGHQPDLCWYCPVSLEKNQKQPEQPTSKVSPETRRGIELHVWTWRRAWNYPKWLTPGW